MGVLAFELIVGRPPFERESRSSTYEAIMYRRPHFPLWISDAAREFITLALVKVRMAKHPTQCLCGQWECGSLCTV
jgi:aurora kinase